MRQSPKCGLINFLKAVFHKIYLVYSWILCPKYFTASLQLVRYSLERLSSLIFSLRGRFGCQRKLPKWNTAKLRLWRYTNQKDKKNFHLSGWEHFSSLASANTEVLFFWPKTNEINYALCARFQLNYHCVPSCMYLFVQIQCMFFL